MSRRPHAELQFGSDSFLDVIANIVGILIILIVVAGIRAGKAPELLSVGDVTQATAPEPLPLITTEPDSPGLPVLFAAEPPPPRPSVVPPPEPPPVEPPKQLIEHADRLQEELQTLLRDHSTLGERLSSEHKTAAVLAGRIEALKQQLSSTAADTEAKENESRKTAAQIEAARKELADLVRQIRQAEADEPDAEAIEHRINPISRVVQGNERHFRMEKGRISEVPIDKLSEQLRVQVERRKDSLMKIRQYKGEVGPIDGFKMTYLVERAGLSVVDELKFGPGMYRIAVSRWTIEPSGDLPSESVDQALKAGSRFYSSLLQAGRGATLTFWIYPDSFAEYRSIQRFAHEHGFMVAGRPLPPGIPIMGSPNGSRSTAQ